MSTSQSQTRAKKRGNSLLLRLTALQVWRSVGISLRINIAVILIFLPVLFIYVNYQAYRMMPLLREVGEHSALVAQSFDCEYWISNESQYGMILPDNVAEYINMPRNTVVYLQARDWLAMDDIRYGINAPTDNPGEYINLSFDLVPALSVLLSGLVVLFCLEFFMILFGIFGIRRSTKKILRPINDLTAAAQTMNIQPPAPVQAAHPELKLTSTIDTLNTITEDHLDKRISIDDEREELKGLAAAINAMLDRLDAAYQAQLRFVSDASHELRTPISVIQGYANLLDRWGKRDEKALQESIDAIKSEAQGMESLVEQLLFLARSDNSSLKVNPKDIDISALVEEVLRETEMIDQRHIVTGNITAGLYVYGDGQLIKQAVRVFVDNALKYTPEGGRVRLSVAQDGAEVRISVSDTGIGIADKDLSQVFERFFRADESRTRKTGGTGLGLAIARYIIDTHGGYMEIVSRENIGTKITAVLPAKIARALDRPDAPSEEPEPQRPEAV
jgi:signal transduction histidine kinase